MYALGLHVRAVQSKAVSSRKGCRLLLHWSVLYTVEQKGQLTLGECGLDMRVLLGCNLDNL